jgi:predicted  nucleic acid-binding Zn-ribbon protein
MSDDPVVTWPDCCRRLDELEAEVEHLKAVDDRLGEELHGGLNSTAGEEGWIGRAVAAESEVERLTAEVGSLRGHEAKLLDQVDDLGGDLTAARESEQHAWQIVENQQARLTDLRRTVDAVVALCDSEGRLGLWVPIRRVRDAMDGEA